MDVKRTSQSDLMMLSAFVGKADMARCNAKHPPMTQADINLICKGHRDGRAKRTKINHTPSNYRRRNWLPHTGRRFSLLIFIVSLSLSTQCGDGILPANMS